MRGPNHGIDLGRVEARIPEQGPNLFQVMLLLQHLHRNPIWQSWGFSIGYPMSRQMFLPCIGDRLYGRLISRSPGSL